MAAWQPRRTVSVVADGWFSSTESLSAVGVYCEETLCTSVLNTFRQMRSSEQLCDVTLEAGDVQLSAHRALLAACSPYFRCMFASGLRESKENFVRLEGVDGDVLAEIVDFFYSGKLLLRKLDLEETLRAASLFQLPGVREAAAEMLQRRLGPSNCLSIRAFAAAHGAQRLQAAADAYARRHFQKVLRAKDEFLALDVDDLERLLSSDGLNVESEESVYEAVMAWTEYNADKRACLLPRLLARVSTESTSCTPNLVLSAAGADSDRYSRN